MYMHDIYLDVCMYMCELPHWLTATPLRYQVNTEILGAMRMYIVCYIFVQIQYWYICMR